MIFNYFLHLILLWIAVILTDMDSPGVYKAWYYPCMIWLFQRAQSHPLWNARLPSCSLWLRSRDCGGKSATVSTPWSSLVSKLECKPGVRACLWRMESYVLWVKLQSIVQKKPADLNIIHCRVDMLHPLPFTDPSVNTTLQHPLWNACLLIIPSFLTSWDKYSIAFTLLSVFSYKDGLSILYNPSFLYAGLSGGCQV